MTPILVILGVLAFANLGQSQTVNDCPAFLTRDKYLKVYGNLCYQFVVYRQRPYSSADSDCRSRGGTLVVINSQALTDYLVDQLVYEVGYAAKVWIGLNDRQTEGVYQWADGSPLAYTNWAANQGPLAANTSAANEDCVTMSANLGGTWADDICEDGLFGFVQHHYPYICQFHTRSTTAAGGQTTPSGCPPFSCTIDCGGESYLRDPDSGCPLCQCGSS